MGDRGSIHGEGRRRVLVEALSPDVDHGRHAAKRVLGERVVAGCDMIADGHDALGGTLLYRRAGESEWMREPLTPGTNDRWGASFVADTLGEWEFTAQGWIDAFATWRRGMARKIEARQDVDVDVLVGARLLREAAARATEADRALLARAAAACADTKQSGLVRFNENGSESIAQIVARYPDLSTATLADTPRRIVVEPALARFSAWYELFPRSCGKPGVHGTLQDVVARLPYVKELGFDILYLPPIHPIGRSFRKGKNNTLNAGPDDVGSPWAIGASEGGHKAVHPQLGTLDDLRNLVAAARKQGIEIALDIAFQASPDHPYVKAHPEWFLKRPDGTIQYAENPPKKYQDVYPFDFEGEAWESLWNELESVIAFWCEQGVRVFRVDNPHTKSLRFWEWCLREVKRKYPDAIFLAEAFTRPKLMYALAKSGFTQSYTYFTWRHTKEEFTRYLTELSRDPVSDFYRPNFWPNTPDILPEHLQFGGRATFVMRLLLAATLSSNFGIYGPTFELMEHVARPGAEEYIDSEKFEIRAWDLEREDSLGEMIALVNQIRRENTALQDNLITFHPTDNDYLLCFSKRSADGTNVVLVVVNLDAHHSQAGWADLDLAALGLKDGESFQVHDLLADARYQWNGVRAYVELNPAIMPASIFRVRRRVRSENDFEYFL